MPRKPRKKQPEFPASSEPAIDQKLVAEFRQAMDAPAIPATVPPESPAPPPAESHVLRHRPTGPLKRKLGDERGIYEGVSVRLSRVTTNESDEYYLAVTKPLTSDTVDGERMFVSRSQADRLIRDGFDDISDCANGSMWRADAHQVQQAGVDMNVLAVVLDGKGERLAQGRGR